MHHHILNLGIINRALRLCAPCVDRGFLRTEHAGNMDAFRVLEFNALRVFDAAAHHKMQPLIGGGFCHDTSPWGERMPVL